MLQLPWVTLLTLLMSFVEALVLTVALVTLTSVPIHPWYAANLVSPIGGYF
jgi:hypothetical protein